MKGRKYTQTYLSGTVHDSVRFLPINLPGFFSFFSFVSGTEKQAVACTVLLNVSAVRLLLLLCRGLFVGE